MSDHLPSFTCLDTHLELKGPPKYIQIETNDKNSLQQFYADINGKNIMQALDLDFQSNPSNNYEILEKILCEAKEKYLPKRTVKFDKYKHNIPFG